MTDLDMDADGATPIDQVIARIKGVYRTWTRGTTVAQMRQDWETLFGSAAVDAAMEPVSIGDLRAEWVTTGGCRDDRVVLYLHGGGFQVGSTRTHRELMAGISREAGLRVLGIDYRRAPEHGYPAPLQDTLAAYDWLIEQGFLPGQIALAGDSAGGGLCLSALLWLRDHREAKNDDHGGVLPAAAVLMSPWTDLTASGASYDTRAQADPIHQRALILTMARNYLCTKTAGAPDVDPRDPLVSPLFAALDGLPPLLIQVGDRETVLSDSTDFAQKARAAGVLVDLEVWPDMIHVFQQFPSELIEARQALRSIGEFLRRHLG